MATLNPSLFDAYKNTNKPNPLPKKHFHDNLQFSRDLDQVQFYQNLSMKTNISSKELFNNT